VQNRSYGIVCGTGSTIVDADAGPGDLVYSIAYGSNICDPTHVPYLPCGQGTTCSVHLSSGIFAGTCE
jgi:hypothetical protein